MAKWKFPEALECIVLIAENRWIQRLVSAPRVVRYRSLWWWE
jgi:hypothetical protein